ncbi:unnamed protein product [Caenorhabditis angaria]|uniref:Seven TM Receptor n=1 Tax=Caenorhabditis angaria TaxID=860376 RepID=A0A9P1IW78_9PELO|nr:unnamed protein product [Caenorhabditis angaria]
MLWSEIVKNVQYWSTFFSLTFNIILLCLIVFKSPKRLGSYKYLMVYLVIFEIVYSITDVVASPSIYIHESVHMVFINQKNRSLNKSFLQFFLTFYCGCFGFSLCVFSVQFYYRYLVAFKSKILKTLNDWRIVFWFLCPLSYGVIWAIVSSCILYQTPEANEFVRYVILRDFDMNIEDIIFVGPYFYPQKNNGRYDFDIRSFLFYALLVQTIIPVMLIHIPVSILFLFTIFEIDVGNMADILSVTIAVFPAIDPLPTMFIIKNYRLRIWSFICFCKNQTLKNADTNLEIFVVN